jgi:hypothetical protein
LNTGTRWIQQGTQKIEQSPLAARSAQLPGSAHRLKSGMKIWRKQKSKTVDGQALGGTIRWKVHRDSQVFQNVRASGPRSHRPIAMFRHDRSRS